MTGNSGQTGNPYERVQASALSKWLPRVSSVVGSLYFFIHSLWVICGPEHRLMDWLYDDCFYYLITAKHLWEQQLSSFDGITLTNGYHPLWMWLCALVYGSHEQLDLDYVRRCMILSLCLSSGILFAILYRAWTKQNNGMLWALCLATTSYSALNNGLTVMEWPVVLLSWLLVHSVIAQADTPEETQNQRLGILFAFLAGIAGSLSRTDFGLITFCYLIGGLWVGRRKRNWRVLQRAASSFGGAVVGLLLGFAYFYRTTGAWLQRSAAVKRQFAAMNSPFNPVPAIWQFARVLLYAPRQDLNPQRHDAVFHRAGVLVLGTAVVALVAIVAKRQRIYATIRNRWRNGKENDWILVAASAGITGYACLYGLDSEATFGWYTATVTGFIVLLAAAWLGSLKTSAAAAMVLPLMFCNVGAAQYFGGSAVQQYQEVQAGKRMHAEHPEARMAGGDVGKPSFYNGGKMINLDGLMNNEIYPYMLNGKIQCYLLYRNVEYMNDLGGITTKLTILERAKLHLPPLPANYLTIVGDPGDPSHYLKFNMDVVRSSGECDDSRPQEISH